MTLDNFWEEHEKRMAEYRRKHHEHNQWMHDHHLKMIKTSKFLWIGNRSLGIAAWMLGTFQVVLFLTGSLSVPYLVLGVFWIGLGFGWWFLGKSYKGAHQDHIDRAEEYRQKVEDYDGE